MKKAIIFIINMNTKKSIWKKLIIKKIVLISKIAKIEAG